MTLISRDPYNPEWVYSNFQVIEWVKCLSIFQDERSRINSVLKASLANRHLKVIFRLPNDSSTDKMTGAYDLECHLWDQSGNSFFQSTAKSGGVTLVDSNRLASEPLAFTKDADGRVYQINEAATNFDVGSIKLTQASFHCFFILPTNGFPRFSWV